MYTAPGWVNVFLGIINFFLFLPFMFKDKRVAAREQMLIHGNESEKDAWKAIKPDYLVSWALIFSHFVFVFNFVLLESLGTPLTMEQFAWTKQQALKNMAILMTVGGALGCVTFLSIGPLCKRFRENDVLIVGGFLIMVLGRFVHIPYGNDYPKLASERDFLLTNESFVDENDPKYLGCPPSQEWCKTTPALGFTEFILGYLLTAVGYPIGLTLIQTIFSKILGPRPQGVFQGYMTGSGCLSRLFGPISVSVLYSQYGIWWLSVITAVMMVVPTIWLVFIRKRLLIENVELKSIEIKDMSQRGLNNLIKDNPVISNGTDGEKDKFLSKET